MAKKSDTAPATMQGMMESINQNYGVNTITSGVDMLGTIPRIPFGVFVADFNSGGGCPVHGTTCAWGKESSGKSTLGINLAIVCNLLCWRCFRMVNFCECSEPSIRQTAYIGDIEGTMDKEWASAIGLPPDSYYHGLADYGEQHINIADYALRADDCGLVVADSLAQLIPESEMNAPLEDKFIGQQALLITRMVRKLKQRLIRERKRGHPCIIFFVNQLRMKIGVTYGCFHSETPVMFADGAQYPIRDVVQNKMKGPVLSWDGCQIVHREITGWHENGRLSETESWVTIQSEGMGGIGGKIGLTCTNDHILVDGGGRERPASTFKVGDTLLSWYERNIPSEAMDIIIGSLLGDGGLSLRIGHGKLADLKLSNSEQPDYLKWKLSQLSCFEWKRIESCNRVTYASNSSFELGLLRKRFYPNGNGYRTVHKGLVKQLSPLSLAVWFMDDGCYVESHRNASICVKRLSFAEGHRVATELSSLYPGVTYRESSRVLFFPVDTFRVFSRDIAKYVCPEMSYKLLPEHRDQAVGYNIDRTPVFERVPYSTAITSVYISKKKNRDKRKYDLTIDGDSFYLVGGSHRGVVVHNSPEIMPGGQGLKHEFSLLFRCNKLTLKTSGSDAKYYDANRQVDMATRHNISVYKNKVAVLGNSGEYVRCTENIPDLGLQKGQVDDINTVLSVAKDYDMFAKRGTKYVAGDFEFDKVQEAKEFFTNPENYQAYVDFQQRIVRAAIERMKGG